MVALTAEPLLPPQVDTANDYLSRAAALLSEACAAMIREKGLRRVDAVSLTTAVQQIKSAQMTLFSLETKMENVAIQKANQEEQDRRWRAAAVAHPPGNSNLVSECPHSPHR